MWQVWYRGELERSFTTREAAERFAKNADWPWPREVRNHLGSLYVVYY